MSRAAACGALVLCSACTAVPALAARPGASQPGQPVLRVDVDGDGSPDLVGAVPGGIVVSTAEGTLALRTAGRLDGIIRLPGVREAVLLLRARSGSEGFVDGLYRLRGSQLERLHVEGGIGDGVATAVVGRTYVDVDCGAPPRSIAQIELEALGRLWRRTELTFVLRGARFVLAHEGSHVVTISKATHRRCAVVRR